MVNLGRARVAIVGATVVGLLLAGCSSSSTRESTNTVNALWYGKQKNGSIAQGVTPVTVATLTTDQGGFDVDLRGFESANAGAYWNSAAWSAAAVAVLASATDPRNLEVKFDVEEQIDGPSAGGLLAAAVRSDLLSQEIPSNKTMTGTILPNGGIGPVGGIPAKLRAAHDAGITEVLIPRGQVMSTDPATGQSVNVVEQGQQLGIKVTEVASLTEAKDLLSGTSQKRAQADTGPIDERLLSVVEVAAKAALADVAQNPLAPAVVDSLTRARARVEAQVREYVADATAELAKGRPIEALSTAAAAARMSRGWNARAAAVEATADAGVEETAKSIAERASSQVEAIERRITEASQTPVGTQEQVVSLADALSWGTDALARTTAVKVRMTNSATTQSVAFIGREAADLAESDYDAEFMLKTAVDGLLVTGDIAISDAEAVNSFLAAYADFLAEAAEANGRYFEQIAKASGGSDRLDPALQEDLDVVAAGRARWEAVRSGTSSPEVAVKLSQAISRYIDSTVLIASHDTVTSAGDDSATSRVQILNGESLKVQQALATVSTEVQSRIMAARSLDSSYARWSDAWGADLASAATSAKADDDDSILRGLVYQWFANVQAAITLALNLEVETQQGPQ